jgi:hypothetical protein
MKLVNEVNDNGLSRNRIVGVSGRWFALGFGWISRWTQRPRLVKVPYHASRSWCRRCIWFYRLGIGYRIGR